MNPIRSSSPVAKVTNETFDQDVSVGGTIQRLTFTRRVLWLQESESTCQFIHGGHVLKEGSTFTDWYGYLTSMNVDSPSPTDLCHRFGITDDSSLELVVITTVFLRPVIETPETAAFNATKPPNHKAQFAEVSWDWRQEKVVDGELRWSRLERQVLGDGTTWSSKASAETNAAVATAFREKWTPKPLDAESERECCP